MRAIIDVKENDNGEYFIELPPEILDHANLKEGDTIIWVNNNDGSWTLIKKEKMKLETIKKIAIDAGFIMAENEKSMVNWSSNYDEELKAFAFLIMDKTISILNTQKNIINYKGEDNCKQYIDDCIADIRNYFCEYN